MGSRNSIKLFLILAVLVLTSLVSNQVIADHAAPPIAVDDSVSTDSSLTTDEDTPFSSGDNVITSNDTDVDEDDTPSVQSFNFLSLTGIITTSSTTNASFTYDPDGQFEALDIGDMDVDTFSYVIVDTSGATDSADVNIKITGANDAPVLIDSTFTLTNINEDDTSSAGDTVADIILTGGDAITDVDEDAVEGIAVTGADNSNGAWQFSINNGGAWTAFGEITEATSVLLDDSAMTKIRFVPDGDYNGSAGDITFRAWDQTAGANGNTGVEITATGGTTAYSSDTDTATLTE